MKAGKWIGTVLITLLVVAILAAGGYALYRYGYSRGAVSTHMGEGLMFHDFEDMPFAPGHMRRFPGAPLEDLPQQFRDRLDMPYHRDNLHMTPYGGMWSNWNFFSPFTFILKLLFLGLIVWLIYKLIMLFTGGKGWQLSYTPKEESPDEPEKKRSRSSK